MKMRKVSFTLIAGLGDDLVSKTEAYHPIFDLFPLPPPASPFPRLAHPLSSMDETIGRDSVDI